MQSINHISIKPLLSVKKGSSVEVSVFRLPEEICEYEGIPYADKIHEKTIEFNATTDGTLIFIPSELEDTFNGKHNSSTEKTES